MALMGHNLELVERGQPAIIPELEWQGCGLDDACNTLAELGIIGLKRVGAFQVVEPRRYVGHLRLPGRSITISPRSPRLFSTLRYLLPLSAGKNAIGEELHAPTAEEHALDPAVSFVDAVEHAVYEGLPSGYQRTATTASHLTGNLLVSETVVQLHARGVFHKARCSVAVRRYDDQVISVILTTASLLRETQVLPTSLLLRLDHLCDAVGEGVSILPTTEATSLAEKLLPVHSEQPALVKVLERALTILRGEQILWDMEVPLKGGECRFCDVDRLWELAVLTAFRLASRELLAATTEFHPLAQAGLSLFSEGGPQIDPDLIVYQGGVPLVVVDAKYSRSSTYSADDVYQILSYARRLGAPMGILVYLSTAHDWYETLSGTGDGVLIAAAGVPSHDPLQAMFRMARAALKQCEQLAAELFKP